MTDAPARVISPVNLSRAIDACLRELGPDAVITSPEGLREFRDPYGHPDSEEFDASAAVLPTTSEQVQAVVRIANTHRVPLWMFGQGRNATYGGPAPRVRDSILVNLRRMNRILEVNSELAYVVVEPGVRWFDLYEALAEQSDGALWTSLPDLGWGSVVGNALEYGVGYTPYGDHAGNVCGLEVVLPDGSLLRTGMGAMTGNPAWHVYPHNYGPSFDGLFQQSNLGIVTRMGFWVMPRPQTYAACMVALHGLDVLEPVIDAIRELMLDRTIESHPLFMHGFELDEAGERRVNPAGDGWLGYLALYGRNSLVDHQYGVVEERLQRIPGVRLVRRTFDGADVTGMANHYQRVQRGIPDMDMLNPAILPFGEFTAHLDFSPVVPTTGRDVVRTERLVRSIYARHGQPCRSAVIVRPRNTIKLSSTFFDIRNQEQIDRVYAGYADLVAELGTVGHSVPYRTNLQSMDLVAEQFDFGGHAQRRLAETIKHALDPHGILAPGKSGVWPTNV